MFSKAVVLFAGVAAASAAHHHHNATTITEVVDVWTTFCPEPTHLTMNNKTYTVTEACTFTITDCPCTVTHVPTVVPTSNPPPKPTTAIPTGVKPPCPGGKECPPPVVAGAGQNSVAYGMAVVGALAAAAVAL